jgi:hypothetical protein
MRQNYEKMSGLSERARRQKRAFLLKKRNILAAQRDDSLPRIVTRV